MHRICDVHQAAAIIVEQCSIAFIIETALSAGQLNPVGLEEELEKHNGIGNAQASILIEVTSSLESTPRLRFLAMRSGSSQENSARPPGGSLAKRVNRSIGANVNQRNPCPSVVGCQASV